MADAVYLHGLGDFDGETLAVFLAGLDCGDFPVRNGQITVPFGSGPPDENGDGLLTERWLTQVSAMGRNWGLNTVILNNGEWNVPCVIGYRYVSRGQLLRPQAPETTGARTGPAFGKPRHVSQVAMQLVSTRGLKVGTSFDRLSPVQFMRDNEVAYTPTEMFTGILRDVVEDEKEFDGQLAWEVEGPYSAQVSAIGGFITTED
ncbi:MAG: hypothetical protein AB7F22_07825 [Reyranella sp.]|uniref:hypothetical protein n=1 Tax=Reyranella sp. TaxID=1929291 RepID=UPI003D1155F0